MRNFFRLFITLIFRLSFWVLITSNFKFSNIIIGLIISVIIPFGSYKSLQLGAIIPSIFNVLKILPNLIIETFQIIRIKRPTDVFTVQPMNLFALRGSRLAQFIQVLAITSTPMSIVAGKKDDSNWVVHTVGNERENQ